MKLKILLSILEDKVKLETIVKKQNKELKILKNFLYRASAIVNLTEETENSNLAFTLNLLSIEISEAIEKLQEIKGRSLHDSYSFEK